MKVVVVGCTHAGTSAVKSILANHPEAEVTVYERNDNISFLSCGIALYVGGVVKNAADLFYSNPEELASLGATVKMEHNVEEINVDDKTVTAKNLQTGATETVSYDKLVMKLVLGQLFHQFQELMLKIFYYVKTIHKPT